MPRSTVESYQARLSMVPPVEKSFPAGAGSDGGLVAAKYWAEDQIRAFLTQHPLPHDLWHAGTIFAVAREEGRYEQLMTQLTVHTEEGEYVFEWDEVP
ncbi:MAG TPA: hypothetical protein VMT45_09085 [Thermoanaerobaculaceae bacterium]|nr:hypothetical protein [Thermoanaerobaculaceae bacterium]